MRWERLFDDLEAVLESDDRAAMAADVTDLVRAERVGISLVDRLRAHLGVTLTWTLLDGQRMEGELLDVGVDWVLVGTGRSRQMLLRLAAIEGVEGLSRLAAPAAGQVARRLGVGSVLRGLARDRAFVTVRLGGGRSVDGTIDRVGADHVDIALHPRDEARRWDAVTSVRCLPVVAIMGVGTT